MGNYLGVTKEQQKEMMNLLGINSTEELYQDIPEHIRLTNLEIRTKGLSQLEIIRKMKQKADSNTVYQSCFRGAGAYKHFIPPIVDLISQKESFVTSYTPYQPEISQGILQIIYEFQTYICELTGMDVANASVYDGATAAAEAIAMCQGKNKKKVLLSSTINPEVYAVLKTYQFASDIEIQMIPEKNGITDMQSLNQLLTSDTACVYLEHPNYYGMLEDLEIFTANSKRN